MSDMSTVIVGVVAILSCVALTTWLARPADFRPVRIPRAERPPRPPRVPRAARVPAAAPVPRPQPNVAPALAHLAAQQEQRPTAERPANALPEPSLAERLAIRPSTRRNTRAGPRSFL